MTSINNARYLLQKHIGSHAQCFTCIVSFNRFIHQRSQDYFPLYCIDWNVRQVLELVRIGAEMEPRLSVDSTQVLTILLSRLLQLFVSNLLPPPQFKSSSPLARILSQRHPSQVYCQNLKCKSVSRTLFLVRRYHFFILGSTECSFKFIRISHFINVMVFVFV